MSVQWSWGWEVGTQFQSYANSGWLVGTNLGLSASNLWGSIHHSDAFQPAAGYGGGQYCLALGAGGGAGDRLVRTPVTGPGSIGTHSQFIYHNAYKREGVTGSDTWEFGEIFGFFNGNQPVLLVTQTASFLSVSAISLYMWNGAAMVLQGTSTTTYTDTQPYHRIVVDADLATGIVTLYVNGVAEIGPTTGPTTITSINNIEWRAGCGVSIANPSDSGVGGGRHDHCVLWDAGNHSTGDCIITAVPANNETVIVGGKTYTFRSSLTDVDGYVYQGTTAAEARENLINAINLGPNLGGAQYAASMSLNTIVRAQERLSTTAVHVVAKLKGPEVGATTDTLATGGDGWVSAALSGGDLDKTNDLALALGNIFIQGLTPTRDVVKGAFLNVNGVNDGTNVDLFANVNDGLNLTDFIQTLTSPDAVEFGHEVRADVGGGVAAAGTLTASGAFTDTETATIGGQVYTFRTPFADVAGAIDASGTIAQTMENLRRAINGDGVAGTNYGTGTPVNVDVTAVDTPTTVVATAIISGSGGNGIGTTTSGANLLWSGATLGGGTENWVPTSIHTVQTIQIMRASGAITEGRTTLEIPSLGKNISDVVPLSSAGILVPQLREWDTGNTTTDVDGIESGTEV